MRFIYYNVSGYIMEILQILLKFFTEEGGGGALSPIIKLLKDNSFDVKKTVSNLNVETVAPIIKEFLFSSASKNAVPNGVGVAPISNVADKDIVYTLNKYLGE